MDVSESTNKKSNSHTGFLWLATFIAAMGSLLFGYDTGIVNGSLEFMAVKGQLDLTAFQQGIVSSGLTLGAAFGAIIGGPFADKIGRKKILTILGIIFSVGALGCAFATNITILIVFRFVLGLAVGSASANVPVYIAEIAPTELRGKMVTTAQVMIVSGQFVAFGVNAALTPLCSKCCNLALDVRIRNYSWHYPLDRNVPYPRITKMVGFAGEDG